MGAAVPSAAGLFGAMQLGLTHSEKNRIRITPYLHDHLMDFKMLAQSMTQKPTRLAKIVPDYPSVIGAVDTAQVGMEGVLFAEGKHPIMWCMTTYSNAW